MPMINVSSADYQVWSPFGLLVLQAPAACRYPKNIELSLMEAGYTILLHGKPVSKPHAQKG